MIGSFIFKNRVSVLFLQVPIRKSLICILGRVDSKVIYMELFKTTFYDNRTGVRVAKVAKYKIRNLYAFRGRNALKVSRIL